MLFSWIEFDNNPVVWWILGHLGLGFLSVWLILRHRPMIDWSFLVIIFSISGLMRLPAFLYNLPLNPDESQMLAQGLTLTVDPLLYRSVDPTTSGPINNYLLSVLHLLGFKLDFHLAHVLSWLLTMLSLALFYKTLKYFQLGIVAQLALIPSVAFVSFVQEENLVHYYSEGVAILLLSINVLLIARWTHYRRISIAELVIFGVSTALVVLCKIQALPLAFVLGFWSLVLIYLFQKSNIASNVAVLAAAIASVWGGWIFYMWTNGVLEEFVFYYIQANAQFKMHFSDSSYRSPFYLLVRFPLIFLILGKKIKFLFVPFGILAVGFLLENRRKSSLLNIAKQFSFFWVMLLIYLLAVIATLIRTGSFYAHHFIYFILPFCLFLGLFLSKTALIWRWSVLATQLIFVFIFGIQLVKNTPINAFSTSISKQNELSAVGRAIQKYGKPGEYLVVWGWSCEYYVETQMPQGVNENHSVRSAMKHPLQERYYKRYLNDMKRSKPTVFVDAMTTKTLWMDDPSKYGHQNFPELAQYVADNYSLKEEIDGIKIYARKQK